MSPQSTDQPDYSQEGYVIEDMTTLISFDNDGKRERKQTTRVRVKSDSGVQGWGLLDLPYQSAVETLDVTFVRVKKPDGTVINTPADNVQDLDAEITRSAPFYSDLREKHVAVKGLSKGDVLEYEANWHPIKPLIPGQFWMEYNFHRSGIVLNEKIEIRTPNSRPAKSKGPQGTQKIETDGTSRVYSWSYSKLQATKETDSEGRKMDAALGRSPAPDVQFSSFQTWEDVGRWYWGLQKDRTEPSPAVRAKAAELTKGMADDGEKIRALYKFVSTQYRYIGISFGIGRYQPHFADDVLGNNYGDCKDKHTLLASLLQASGITVYPALIDATNKLDPDVPSPGQFDHIIGYLPQGKSTLWLDSTPEVSPPGYLMPQLRDKSALVMYGDRPAHLITTPPDPPFPSTQTFKIEGKLKEDGSLDARVEDSIRGDNEVAVRSIYRRTPEAQWKDLTQQISFGLGYSGTVSDVVASAPEAMDEPFHFSYNYHRKDYPDWTNHQFSAPGLPFYMPSVRDDQKEPIWLGSPMEMIAQCKIELPPGYKPENPPNVDLKYDFAEYHAKYEHEQGVLTCRRQLNVKMREVPVAEFEDYRRFLKSLSDDRDRYVQTTQTGTLAPAELQKQLAVSGNIPAGAFTLTQALKGLANMPESSSEEANRFETNGRAAMRDNNSKSAEAALKRALDADPKFTRASVELATVYLTQQQNDAALDVLRKAIDADAKAEVPRRVYAYTLTFLRRDDAAYQAWLAMVKIAPDDAEANSMVATSLIQKKQYAEALPYLEAAAKDNNSPEAQAHLGATYLQAGQIEKGSAILQKVIDSDANAVIMNDVAYELAESNTSLAKALEYSERAVAAQENQSHELQLSSLLQEDIQCTMKIGMFWDTLGWVEFKNGHFNRAESYLQSAWLLTQLAVVADHLGQVYEKDAKLDKAIHMYRLAIATPEGRSAVGDQARKHLEHLGGKVPSTPFEAMHSNDHSGQELSELRTEKLKQLTTETATAEFFLVFNAHSKVDEALFIGGSEKLKSAENALTGMAFQFTFPPESSARILRRAILMCSKISGCHAVLYTPGSVHSIN